MAEEEDKVNPKPDSERKFASRMQRFAKQQPDKIREIVEESDWGKKKGRQIDPTHKSLLDVWFGKE